jgi:M6 family metalloprotease-like protein
MTRTLPRILLGLVFLLGLIWPLTAADAPESADDKKLDLSEFKTVEKATPAAVSKTGPATPGQSGYLGVHVAAGQGKVVVADVAADSPAAKAGLQKDDVLVKLGDQEIRNPDVFREMMLSHRPGDEVKIVIVRRDKQQEITAKLAAVSRPMGGARPGPVAVQAPTFGIMVDEIKEGEGGVITRVAADSPAAQAGLKKDEIVTKIDGRPITDANTIGTTISEKRPGDAVTVTVKRDGKPVDVKVTLGGDADPRAESGLWRKSVYRLGVICIEYPDQKHNEKITTKDWNEGLFSRDTFNQKNPTGQTVYGSLADYFHEVSCGALKVEGKVFDWIEVKKNRVDYAPGNGTGVRDKTALLAEAVEKVQARDGADALKDFDGLCFVYAGDRAATNRGSLYWPHRGQLRQGRGAKGWSYILCNEITKEGGGSRMTSISPLCRTFGQLLGLPELSAKPDVPGSKGAGIWCAMAGPGEGGRFGGGGRAPSAAERGQPGHFCAWSKEQLGWLKPTVIDPTVKQKLILSPIEGSAKECYKVLVKLDGSEYLLLENRSKKGFDESLPAEGLLIWRVVNNHPTLEESHGAESAGPRASAEARALLETTPYPSKANDSFTPKTVPSSKSQLGGGLPVNITNIRRLPDGRIVFETGYEYQ